MNKFMDLFEKLSNCYNRIHYLDYLKLSSDEKDDVCSKEKADLRNFLNSDSLSNENILKEKISYSEGKVTIN